MTINKGRTLGYYPGGSVKYHWGNFGHTENPQPSVVEYLRTELSPGPPYTQLNDFRAIRDERSPVRGHGKGLKAQWDNYPDAYNSNYGYSEFPQGYFEPNYESLTNAALKISNPNKPVIDVPLFLFELKDAPDLIRDLGIRSLYGKDSPGAKINPGKRHLSEQFGWKPLFDDLRTLLHLSDEIDARLEKLRNQSKKQKISGKLPGRSDSKVDPGAYYHFYLNTYIWFKKEYKYEEVNWFTANFEVDQEDLLSLDNSKKEQLRWALGLNASASTIWNAVPWSWLSDYFVTIGDYLDARRGGIKWKASHMCIMSTTSYRRDDKITSTNGWANSSYKVYDGYATRVIKRRKVVAYPTSKVVWFPFLSEGKATNLAALTLSVLSGDQSTARIARR